MRRGMLLALVFVFAGAVLFSGCETSKGVAIGVGATAQGVVKDSKTTWDGIKQADAWVKKNLW
ncbi:MAG: hypothetical protein KJ880_01570 [Candidatus Omnitrophica bacterium]|nr:hypothetical protein [Candidatus Omnitrophota bacterium]